MSSPSPAKAAEVQNAAPRRHSLKPALLFALALLLSYGIFWTTALVTAHNLGARDGVGYINGGKVFRLTGTMWYHIPGLVDIGLAPQNLGGQVNLRNNEFALLEREVKRLDRMEVDFALDPNALLLAILDRQGEGTFWAVRLTAFEHAGTPFVNALVRYDHGRVTERRSLDGLGLQLAPGKHTLVLERLEGALRVTVDGTSADVSFDTASLVPNLALGCGELNTVVHRWKVDGVASDGSPVAFHETFSVWDTWRRSSGAIGWLALMAWVVLIGLPVSKAIFDARQPPLTLTPSLLLLPLPRVVFGLFGLIPFMPLLLQWVIGGLYVFFVWLSVLEALRGGIAYRLPLGERPLRKRLLSVSGAAIALGLGAFGLAHVVREGPLGETWPAKTTSDGPPIAGAPDKSPLHLGQRVQLAVPSGHMGSAIRFSADLSLDAGEAVRVDLMRSLPTLGDVFQVDRNQDRPSDADIDPDAPADPEKDSSAEIGSDAGVGDYEMRAASVFVSADPGLPGHLRWLHNDKVERSPRSGWLLQPGRHEVEIIAGGRYAAVLIGGRVVDFRADLDPDFQVGGVQILTLSARSTALQNAAVRVATPNSRAALALEAVTSATLSADVISSVAYAFTLLGLLGLLAALALPRSMTAPLAPTLLRLLRAGGLLVLFPILLVLVRFDVVRFELDLLLTLGLASLAFAAFNLRQLLVANGTRSLSRVGAVLVVLFVGFEVLALGFTEWRYGMTHLWSHGLSPAWYYVHDPMVLRLNPWFIDQRFKRRDYLASRALAGNAKAVRVVVFGGSQTYGWGIPSMDRMAFSDQLERTLRRRGHSDVEVLNAAFPGVKTATGLRWFASNLIRYEPDIMVVNFVVNEFMNVDQSHVWSGESSAQEPLSSLVTPTLWEYWRGTVMGNHLSQIIVADVYKTYAMRDYLHWIVTMARERNIEVVFSIEPTNLYVESGGKNIMREENSADDAQAIYREVGKELGVPVYDALPHFLAEPENVWFYDTMHMSRLGHRVFAEHLGELIGTRFLETPASR